MTNAPKMSLPMALRCLAAATMRKFSPDDWLAFAGCDSDDPLIGEVVLDDTHKVVVILDGSTVNVITEETADQGGELFELREV